MKYTIIRKAGGEESFIGEVERVHPSYFGDNVCGLNICLRWQMRLVMRNHSYRPVGGSLQTAIILSCFNKISLNTIEEGVVTISCDDEKVIMLSIHKEDWMFSEKIIEMYDRE